MRLLLPLYCVLPVLLLTGCIPQTSTPSTTAAPTKQYDLGPVSMQLPVTWKALDYKTAMLDSTRQNMPYHRYLFLNTASTDTTFRETILLTVDQRPGAPQLGIIGRELAKNLRASPDQLQLLSFTDTLLHQGQLGLAEATCRDMAAHKDLLLQYAFTAKANVLVAFIGTARSQGEPTDKQNRAVFQQAIQSITWR